MAAPVGARPDGRAFGRWIFPGRGHGMARNHTGRMPRSGLKPLGCIAHRAGSTPAPGTSALPRETASGRDDVAMRRGAGPAAGRPTISWTHFRRLCALGSLMMTSPPSLMTSFGWSCALWAGRLRRPSRGWRASPRPSGRGRDPLPRTLGPRHLQAASFAETQPQAQPPTVRTSTGLTSLDPRSSAWPLCHLWVPTSTDSGFDSPRLSPHEIVVPRGVQPAPPATPGGDQP